MLAQVLHGSRVAAGGVRAWARDPQHALASRLFSTAEGDVQSAQWNDFSNVVKELRRIAQQEGIRGALPDTRLLKELGHKDLVLAIRKKHGGFVTVASKIGVHVDNEDVEIQKKITSRANRRKKREGRVTKHNFY